MAEQLIDLPAMRVAVEGCGHGTLHAIYASVGEACKTKGWDNVDVLIIGGDFQAVRNKLDLNVTAMPAKFRKMADFHEYYSGARTAPCLTIFVGGNHEASNYLFELYYGGWVAPNIYYMGAANIVRIGPLRIAGLSGIWKGYDYNKPHFERLPYNRDDVQSIYHVRELDVRKLLAVRTQVDVGMSHDWPQGIEWAGDHKWLFRKKDLFEADAISGKLGSVAAKQCLERLRPRHWFSAHLHIKYRATLEHGEYRPVRPATQRFTQTGQRRLDPASDFANPEPKRTLRDRADISDNTKVSEISAWQNFHVHAAEQQAVESERLRREHDLEEREGKQNGNTTTEAYRVAETWRKVELGEDMQREVKSVTKNEPMNYDGCNESKEAPDEDDRQPIVHPTNDYGSISESMSFEPTVNAAKPIDSEMVRNEDEIDIDMDDSSNDEVEHPSQSIIQSGGHTIKGSSTTSGEEGGVKLHSSTSDGDASLKPQSEVATTQKLSDGQIEEKEHATGKEHAAVSSGDPEIPNELREELAALSSNFEPAVNIEVTPSLPLPDTISNKVTDFLALDKCEPNRDFLQVLEVAPISTVSQQYSRPFKLEYDPEWLAIQRVFANDLELSVDPQHPIPKHRGDTYYRDRIIEEEKWVDDNIVSPGKLIVPQNFIQTAPSFDPNINYNDHQMPYEYPNPQTAAYCELIGIENKFDITEAERNDRMASGPRRERQNFNRGRGRGGHNRGGFAGRGGRGRGRGNGRGGRR